MSPSRVEVRRDLLLVGLAAAVLFCTALGARDLWNPNEPIYGQAVVEMDHRGDWMLPTVNGNVFAEKPILYFWMARATSTILGGVTELSLRLPSALAGVAGAILVYLLVCPYAGRLRARLATALYATTFMVFWGSRTTQMDILVMTASLGAVVAASRMLDHGLPPAAGWSLVGLAAGLGFLAKGPVGPICAGVPVLLYMALTRRLHRLKERRLFLAVAAFVAVAAPWFVVLMARGQGDVVVELLYRQNFTRFLDPWDHAAPWWYYAPYFWIDMAPWVWFVPLAVALPDRDGDERRLDRWAWPWIAGVILFFSLSASKRSAYILPVAPAVAILVSGVAERLFDGRLGRMRTRLCLALTVVFGLLALAAGLILRWKVIPDYPDLETQGMSLSVLLTAGGLATVAGLALRRNARFAVPTAFFSLVVVVYLQVSLAVLPAVDAYKSARPFCERVGALVETEHPVATFKLWDFRAGYTYYLGRPIRNLKSLAELRRYWEGDRQVFLIVQGSPSDELRTVIGDRRPWLQAPVGSRTAYLYSNHDN